MVRPTTDNTARNINPDVHEIEKEDVVLNDAKLIKSAVFDETKAANNENDTALHQPNSKSNSPKSASESQSRESVQSYSSFNEKNSIQPPKYTNQDISRFSYSSFNDKDSTLPKENQPGKQTENELENKPSPSVLAESAASVVNANNRTSIAVKEQDFEMVEIRNSDDKIRVNSNENETKNNA